MLLKFQSKLRGVFDLFSNDSVTSIKKHEGGYVTYKVKGVDEWVLTNNCSILSVYASKDEMDFGLNILMKGLV